jgi:hypothetical protein
LRDGASIVTRVQGSCMNISVLMVFATGLIIRGDVRHLTVMK